MMLSRALRWRRNDVIALAGAGGKTTAMFRLARELTARGQRVVTTTTTRMFVSQMAAAPHSLVAEDGDMILRQLPETLQRHGHVLVLSRTDEAHNKAFGIEPALVDCIARLPGVDGVIVEADGARMRPFKAPAPHEPVIPSSTTIAVPIVGMGVLGQPLDERTVHRPELVAELTGASLGQPVTPQMVASVLADPRGGLQHIPSTARVVALLNQVDTAHRSALAEEIARLALQCEAVTEVVIGAAATGERAYHVWGRTAAIVLAAGGASRYGQPKLLLPWAETTLLGKVVQAALAAREVDEVLVVVGSDASQIAAVCQDLPVQTVLNESWEEGQSTSLRAGVRSLAPGTSAAVFLLGDQPEVSPDVIDALVRRHRQTLAAAVLPSYRGERGNPVLFDRRVFADLADLHGDVGGRALLPRLVPETETVPFDDAPPFDVDTPDQYRRMRTR